MAFCRLRSPQSLKFSDLSRATNLCSIPASATAWRLIPSCPILAGYWGQFPAGAEVQGSTSALCPGVCVPDSPKHSPCSCRQPWEHRPGGSGPSPALPSAHPLLPNCSALPWECLLPPPSASPAPAAARDEPLPARSAAHKAQATLSKPRSGQRPHTHLSRGLGGLRFPSLLPQCTGECWMDLILVPEQ